MKFEMMINALTKTSESIRCFCTQHELNVISMWYFGSLVAVILLALSPALARADAKRLSQSIVVTYEAKDSVQSTDSAKRVSDTSCDCHPSLPLEIVTSSLIWGIPAYWGYRGAVDDTAIGSLKVWPAIIAVSIILPLISLAPVANWTSGCEASWWHTLWIGFGSNIACTILYEVAYGHDHVLNVNKFNWPEYAALGVAPTVIASLVYNQFLRSCAKETDEHSTDQGMYFLPSVNVDKSVSMNFGLRF